MLINVINMIFRSKSNVFKPQTIGGFCDADSNTLREDGKYRMELSSWYHFKFNIIKHKMECVITLPNIKKSVKKKKRIFLTQASGV